jgi:hypothetical protein
MRITKNDVPVTVYSYTSAVASDGLVVNSYVPTYVNMMADVQPAGVKFDPALYGINSTPSDVRKMFFDGGYSIVVGMCVKANGVAYMVKGMRRWYTHNEAILDPYDVVLP